MRVLMLSQLYPDPSNRARGTFVHRQVKSLKDKSINVKVVSPRPWSPYPINHFKEKWKGYSTIPKKDYYQGVSVFYPRYLSLPGKFWDPISGKFMYWGVKNLITQIEKNFDFDLIHAHVPIPDGYTGMLLSEYCELPLIITVHGGKLFDLKNKNHGYKSILKVLKNADQIITVSNQNKKMLNELGFYDSKVIHNGVPLKLLQNVEKGKVNRIRSKIHTQYFLLGVGNLVPRKKFDIAIRAISRLITQGYDITYLIIGEGPEKSKLTGLIKDLNLGNRVEILQRRDQLIEVYEYMRASDIFLLPSIKEGFGVVFAEAMALGKPIVGAKEGVVSDLVEDGKNGFLVNRDDVDDIVEVVSFLMDNSKRRKQIGQKAKRYVWNNFSWEGNAEKTKKIYREVVT